MKRMDYVKCNSGTIYLVTQQDDGLELWDFQAWLKGYYDAYIPLKDIDTSEYEVIGDFNTNPELLPKECEGYNGEPHVELVEHIWP